MAHSLNVTADDLDTLTRTMAGEVRGESREGRIAMAWSVRNRATYPASTKWWGNTIKEVCLKAGQFDCWRTGDPNYNVVTAMKASDSLYQELYNLALLVTTGEVEDPTGGATHYLNPTILRGLPNWAKPERRVAIIGAHHFYKLRPQD